MRAVTQDIEVMLKLFNDFFRDMKIIMCNSEEAIHIFAQDDVDDEYIIDLRDVSMFSEPIVIHVVKRLVAPINMVCTEPVTDSLDNILADFA